MGNIPVLKNSQGVPEPVLWSDAAVAEAYQRVARGNVVVAKAFTGMLDAAGDAVHKGAKAGAAYHKRISKEEDNLAKVEYEAAFSKKMTEVAERYITNPPKDNEALNSWVMNTRKEMEGFHSEMMKNPNHQQAFRRIGNELLKANTEDTERFVLSGFSNSFKAIRIAAKNSALGDLESGETCATAVGIANARERATQNGATADEVNKAALLGRSRALEAKIHAERMALEKKGEQDFLLALPGFLNTSLEWLKDESAWDVDADGKLSPLEAIMQEKAIKSFNTAYKSGNINSVRDVYGKETTRQNLRLSKHFEATKDDIWRMAEKDYSASLKAIDAWRDNAIAYYKDPKNANELKAYWPEGFAQCRREIDAYCDKQKEEVDSISALAEKRDTQRKKAELQKNSEILSAVVEYGVYGNEDAGRMLHQLNFQKNVAIANDSVAADSFLSSGHKVANSDDVMKIADYITSAVKNNDGDSMHAALRLITDGSLAFKDGDLTFFSRLMKGLSSKDCPEARSAIRELRQMLDTPDRTYGARKDVEFGKLVSRSSESEKNAMKAYFTGLNKILGELESNGYMGGETVRENVMKLAKDTAGEIRLGASWDKRLSSLRKIADTFGVSAAEPEYDYTEGKIPDREGVQFTPAGVEHGPGYSTFYGSVVKNHDGDTVTIADSNGIEFKIRLRGIDTDEMEHKPDELGDSDETEKEAKKSAEAMAGMLRQAADGRVRVIFTGVDAYGRLLGSISIRRGGKDSSWEDVVDAVYGKESERNNKVPTRSKDI